MRWGDRGGWHPHLLSPSPSPQDPGPQPHTTPTPEAHFGVLKRKAGACLSVRSGPGGNRRRQGAGAGPGGLGSCTGGEAGTPKQKQEQGSCQEPLPGKDTGSSAWHTPPEGPVPTELQIPGSRQGSAHEMGQKGNGGTRLCPHGEPLWHLSPLGLELPASAGEAVGRAVFWWPPFLLQAELLEGPLGAGPQAVDLCTPAHSCQQPPMPQLPSLCPVPSPTYLRPGPTTGLFTGGGGGGDLSNTAHF